MSFVAASVVSDRVNVVERAKVVALMERFRQGTISMQRNWLPGVLVNVPRTPAEVQHVKILDAPFGLLHVMRSPEFRPEQHQVIEKFRAHVEERPRLLEAIQRELRGKRLGCYCAPKACQRSSEKLSPAVGGPPVSRFYR